MKFRNPGARLFVPDGLKPEKALARTTVLCIGAHQDDIEIMAYGQIAYCLKNPGQWFTGITVTNGAGSPRSGEFASMTDEEMMQVRAKEQEEAASIGRYSAVIQLDYPSKAVKTPGIVSEELSEILKACSPEEVYIHNIADKHDTHVATALRAIEAVRSLPLERRPSKLVSLEVWRGLDWLCDKEKVICDTSHDPALAERLVSVYRSQCAGGKRYDKAALGRRLANATFFASHDVDSVDSCSYGLDLTELLEDNFADPVRFINDKINDMAVEINRRIKTFL